MHLRENMTRQRAHVERTGNHERECRSVAADVTARMITTLTRVRT